MSRESWESWKLSTRPPRRCSSRCLFSRWRAELRTGLGVAFGTSGVARFAVLNGVSLAGDGGDLLNSRESCPSSWPDADRAWGGGGEPDADRAWGGEPDADRAWGGEPDRAWGGEPES